MARGRGVTRREQAQAALGRWLEQHVVRAPGPLRARVEAYAAEAAAAEVAAAEVAVHGAVSPADALARAGQAALERVLAHPGDRSVALDLLAADALVTLALLAQAKQAPQRLGRFADGLLRAGLPAT